MIELQSAVLIHSIRDYDERLAYVLCMLHIAQRNCKRVIESRAPMPDCAKEKFAEWLPVCDLMKRTDFIGKWHKEKLVLGMGTSNERRQERRGPIHPATEIHGPTHIEHDRQTDGLTLSGEERDLLRVAIFQQLEFGSGQTVDVIALLIRHLDGNRLQGGSAFEGWYLRLGQREKRATQIRGQECYEKPSTEHSPSIGADELMMQGYHSLTGRKALLLISDGEDTCSRKTVSDVIEMLQGTDTVFYALKNGGGRASKAIKVLSPGLLLFRSHLDRIAEEAGGRQFNVGRDPLDEAFRQIEEELRTAYSIGYVSSNPARDGKFRRIEIRVARPDLSAWARRGYFARPISSDPQPGSGSGPK